LHDHRIANLTACGEAWHGFGVQKHRSLLKFEQAELLNVLTAELPVYSEHFVQTYVSSRCDYDGRDPFWISPKRGCR